MSETGDDREGAGTIRPVAVAPSRSRLRRRTSAVARPTRAGARVRRVFLWLYVLTASLVAIGVLVQAFSIAAYVRGAGQEALDLHTTGGFITHSVEIVVFLVALGAYWGAWRWVGLAALLPIVGTVQLLLIGDTDTTGGWVNGLHGLFALVVFLLAVVLAQTGARLLRRVAKSI
jgi:hypothetical protein